MTTINTEKMPEYGLSFRSCQGAKTIQKHKKTPVTLPVMILAFS